MEKAKLDPVNLGHGQILSGYGFVRYSAVYTQLLHGWRIKVQHQYHNQRIQPNFAKVWREESFEVLNKNLDWIYPGGESSKLMQIKCRKIAILTLLR